jgi:hypothetical protein
MDGSNVVKTENVTEQQITVNVVVAAVNKKYPAPDGIKERPLSKTWARISRALNRAVELDPPATHIEISVDGVEFLKSCLEPYGPDARTVLVKEDLLDALEDLLKQDDAGKNGATKRESVETRA